MLIAKYLREEKSYTWVEICVHSSSRMWNGDGQFADRLGAWTDVDCDGSPSPSYSHACRDIVATIVVDSMPALAACMQGYHIWACWDAQIGHASMPMATPHACCQFYGMPTCMLARADWCISGPKANTEIEISYIFKYNFKKFNIT